MKKTLMICFGALVSLFVLLVLAFKTENEKIATADFVRIHIRANSNLDKDQTVKQKVRERLVEFLTPLVSNCESIEEAKVMVVANLPRIEEIATEVLTQEKFNYVATAVFNKEKFPTRVYGNFELEAGVYSALVVELGAAKGDNWWCVIFPPLCFVGSENNGSNSVCYRSKLIEIIKSFIKY